MILALDPGETTGWARSDGACGTLSYIHALWGETSAHFSGWLADQISEDGVRVIAYENPIIRHAGTALAFGIIWDTLRVAHLHDLIVPISCTPQQARRAIGITDRGMTQGQRKRAVLEWARSAGWQAQSFHEADAAAVLEWAKKRLTAPAT